MLTIIHDPPSTHIDELPPFPVKRWTREEYHQLAEQGWFDEEKVELLEGWIVPKMVHNPRHASALDVMEGAVTALLPATGCFLRSQRPIVVGDSEPEPDLAVVKGSRGDYTQRHPSGADALWVIEISDSSRVRDRRKAALYAAGGIPNYWIVDIAGKRIEVFAQPVAANEQYREYRIAELADTVELALAGETLAVRVASLLPAGLDTSDSTDEGAG